MINDKKVIFIVDDDIADFEPLESFLTYNGFKVMISRNAASAMNILTSSIAKSIDLIILDSIMAYGNGKKNLYTKDQTENGKLTGLCLLEDIRQKNKNIIVKEDIPIIIYTNIREDHTFEQQISSAKATYRSKANSNLNNILDTINYLLNLDKGKKNE